MYLQFDASFCPIQVSDVTPKDFTISRQFSSRDWPEKSHVLGQSVTTNCGEQNPVSVPVIKLLEVDHGLSSQVVSAVEAERFRLAHELHDGVGQILTGAMMLTEALSADLSGTAKKDSNRILDLIRKATLQIRTLSHLTSPDFLTGKCLSDLLTKEVDYWHAFHAVTCYLNVGLSVKHELMVLHLFRITQEAVHNALRHGRCHEIQINLRQEDEQQGLLEIINDGAPLTQVVSDGIGVRGMKHRAALIQASLNIENFFTGGVAVTCRFPLTQPPP